MGIFKKKQPISIDEFVDLFNDLVLDRAKSNGLNAWKNNLESIGLKTSDERIIFALYFTELLSFDNNPEFKGNDLIIKQLISSKILGKKYTPNVENELKPYFKAYIALRAAKRQEDVYKLVANLLILLDCDEEPNEKITRLIASTVAVELKYAVLGTMLDMMDKKGFRLPESK